MDEIKDRCEVCGQKHKPLPTVGLWDHTRYRVARELLMDAAERIALLRLGAIKTRRAVPEGEARALFVRGFSNAMGHLAYLHGLVAYDASKMPQLPLSIGALDESHQEVAA